MQSTTTTTDFAPITHVLVHWSEADATEEKMMTVPEFVAYLLKVRAERRREEGDGWYFKVKYTPFFNGDDYGWCRADVTPDFDVAGELAYRVRYWYANEAPKTERTWTVADLLNLD